MSLCVTCGKIGDHAKGCAQAPADAFDTSPPARNARTLKALQELQAEVKGLAAIAGTNPRDAAKLIYSLEVVMEKHPSSDLASFEHKRHYKAAEDALKASKAEVERALGGEKPDQIFHDLAFTRKGLELLHGAQLRRREIASFDLSEVGRIPGLKFDPKESEDKTEPSAAVRVACESIEKLVASTASVDTEVDEWGKAYLEPLAVGEAPREFPSNVTGATSKPLGLIAGGVAFMVAGAAVALVVKQQPAGAVVGAIGLLVLAAGVILYMKASSLQRSVPAHFADLSQRFRDRLYLVCVLRSLRGVLSNLSKAEEALRTHTGGSENAARWKRIKTQEKDLVKSLAGDWDEKHPVDDEMAKRIAASGSVTGEAIRPMNELARDDWDGLAKAYQAERREDAESTDETRLAVLAEVVLKNAGQRPEAVSQRRRAITEARNAFTGRSTGRMGQAKGA
jgi:hypothetical protein